MKLLTLLLKLVEFISMSKQFQKFSEIVLQNNKNADGIRNGAKTTAPFYFPITNDN